MAVFIFSLFIFFLKFLLSGEQKEKRFFIFGTGSFGCGLWVFFYGVKLEEPRNYTSTWSCFYFYFFSFKFSRSDKKNNKIRKDGK